MAKLIEAKGALGPTLFGEVPYKKQIKKGTPYTNGGPGTELTLNVLPPGMNIQDQPDAADTKRVAGLEPMGPIIQ